jgi:hypothetical protein
VQRLPLAGKKATRLGNIQQYLSDSRRDGSVAYWNERLNKRKRSGEERALWAAQGRVR